MNKQIEIRPGRRIHVSHHIHPNSDTTLFFIHGMGGRSQQWKAQADYFAPHYSIVMPDLLGHGQSEKPKPCQSHPYRFAEFDLDLSLLFNQFTGKNNIIIGHSYGGALAASLAAKYQDRVHRLVLIAPMPCTSDGVPVPLISRLPCFILEWLRRMIEKKFATLAFDVSTNPSLVESEIIAARENPMYVIKSMIESIQHIPPLDLMRLTIPTLIVLGEHDGIVPPSFSRQFYERMPHHQFNMMQHVAHMCMMEDTKTANGILARYFNDSIATAGSTSSS